MVPKMYNEDWYSFVTQTSFQHCGLVPYGECGAPWCAVSHHYAGYSWYGMVVEQSGMASLDTPVIGTEEYGTTRQSRYSGGAESGMAQLHRWYGTAR